MSTQNLKSYKKNTKKNVHETINLKKSQKSISADPITKYRVIC